MFDGKERRTNQYVFTSERQLVNFYSNLIKREELTDLIKQIKSKPFADRKEGKDMYKLQMLKRIEYGVNRYLKQEGIEPVLRGE